MDDKIKDELEFAAATALSQAIEANNLLQHTLGTAWRAWTEASGLDVSLSKTALSLTDLSVKQAELFIQVLKTLRTVQAQVIHHDDEPAGGTH